MRMNKKEPQTQTESKWRPFSYFSVPRCEEWRPSPTQERQAFIVNWWWMTFTLTFELWDLSCCALGKTFVAGVTGQRHGNAAATQQESNLLTASILLGNMVMGGVRGGQVVSNNKKKYCSIGSDGTSVKFWRLILLLSYLRHQSHQVSFTHFHTYNIVFFI